MAKKKDFREELQQLSEKLRDPFRMRMLVAGVTLAIMFFAIHSPIEARMKIEKREIGLLETKHKTAKELMLLQTHMEKVDPQIIRCETNDVIVAHLIETIRRHPVDLMRIDAEAPVRHGPMHTVRVGIDCIGDYKQLLGVLHAIESDPHLFRVETISLDPPDLDTPSKLTVSIRVLKEKP